MKTSPLGKAIIRESEGLYLKAYLCPAKVWSIGYGHTKGVKQGDTCTVEQANKWLAEDLAQVERVIPILLPTISQNQFDALASFAFNVGIGALKNSTLLRKARMNINDPSIRDEFEKWDKADASKDGKDNDGDGLIDEPGEKKRLEGLSKRRKKEADLYFLK
jgi:lysozyme